MNFFNNSLLVLRMAVVGARARAGPRVGAQIEA